MKKRLFLFLTFLFSVIMFSCTKEVYATENGKETLDLFQLVLYADDSLKASQSKVDLSGIKVDVYSSELHMNGTGGVVTEWDFTTSGSLVTYATTIGATYIKGGMSITNTGANQTGYHITIARN